MKVNIVSIEKNPKTRLIEVVVRFPTAIDTAKFIFTSLPSEIGTEFYSSTDKVTLDKMRGFKKSAS